MSLQVSSFWDTGSTRHVGRNIGATRRGLILERGAEPLAFLSGITADSSNIVRINVIRTITSTV